MRHIYHHSPCTLPIHDEYLLHRSDEGSLSLEEFREALRDLHVTVTRQTLSEVARRFPARTRRGSSRRRREMQWEDKHTVSCGEGTEVDVFLSYGLLVDAVCSREGLRKPSDRSAVEAGVRFELPSNSHERNRGRSLVRTEDKLGEAEGAPGQLSGRRLQLRHSIAAGKQVIEKKEDDDGDDGDRYFVDVPRIRAARLAALDSKDALGRSSIFVASATGAVSALKVLFQHGATPTCTVQGTALTALSVARDALTRRVLADAVRASLENVMSCRRQRNTARMNSTPGVTIVLKGSDSEPAPREAGKKDDRVLTRGSEGDDIDVGDGVCHSARESRYMESMVAFLAENERSLPLEGQYRADMKSSLHVAAAVGLPTVLKNIVARDHKDTNVNDRAGGGSRTGRPAWDFSCFRSPSAAEDCRKLGVNEFSSHPSSVAHPKKKQEQQWMLPLKPDASGRSALHACCAEASPEHYRCALALLESQSNPNLRTNTSRTPLHVAAASVSGHAGAPGGVSGWKM